MITLSSLQHLRLPILPLGILFAFAIQSASADDGDTLGSATAISPGTINRTLTTDDIDWFRFTVANTGLVVIYTEGFVNLDGDLYNQSGLRVRFAATGGADNNFRMAETLQAGTYYLKVQAGINYNQTGDYSLTLRTQETAPLITGSRFFGSLTRGAVNFYSIPVEQVGLFEVYTTGSTNTVGQLYNQVGEKVSGGFNNTSGAGLNFHISISPFQPGNYLLVVHEDYKAAGDYEGFILRPKLAEHLTETPLDRNLDPLGDVDHFYFDVPEYGEVRMWSEGSTTDTQCQLYNAVGVKQNGGYHNNASGTLNFDLRRNLQPGRYFLKVWGDKNGGNPRGAYRMRLDLPGIIKADPHAATRYALIKKIRKVSKAVKSANRKGKKSKAAKLKRKVRKLQAKLRRL